MNLRNEKESPCPALKWLLLQALLLMPIVALALRILGFKRSYVILGRLFSPRNGPFRLPALDTASARQVAATVKIANSRFAPFAFSCLPESLTLWSLLRRCGVPVRFRLGVRTLTGPFESHAWVEYHHEVLNDIENIADIFAPFDLRVINAKLG